VSSGTWSTVAPVQIVGRGVNVSPEVGPHLQQCQVEGVALGAKEKRLGLEWRIAGKVNIPSRMGSVAS